MEKYSVYEHYRRQDGKIIQEGEHMMSAARPLSKLEGFAGSQSVITDYREGVDDFKGIFINAAENFDELETIRKQVKENLKRLP